MCTLAAIEKNCIRNVGGIVEVFLIDPNDLLMLPSAGRDVQYNGNLLMRPGSAPYRIECDRQSAVFTEKSVTTSVNGDYYEQNLAFSTTRDRLSVRRLVAGVHNRKVHLYFKYANGLRKFVPYARGNSEHSSGQVRRDRDQVRFNFSANNAKPALIIAPPTILLGAFTDGYSTGFDIT